MAHQKAVGIASAASATPRVIDAVMRLRGLPAVPKRPKGQKRLAAREDASLVSNAVTVMRIATGEIEEATAEDGKNKAAVELGRKGGTAKATE